MCLPSFSRWESYICLCRTRSMQSWIARFSQVLWRRPILHHVSRIWWLYRSLMSISESVEIFYLWIRHSPKTSTQFLPNEELHQFFEGSKFFSKIDLKWEYLQMKLIDDVQSITAMITYNGLVQCSQEAFGFCSSSVSIRRGIEHIIPNHTFAKMWCMILFFVEQWTEFMSSKSEIFFALSDAWATINFLKNSVRCSIGTFRWITSDGKIYYTFFSPTCNNFWICRQQWIRKNFLFLLTPFY